MHKNKKAELLAAATAAGWARKLDLRLQTGTSREYGAALPSASGALRSQQPKESRRAFEKGPRR